MRLRVVSAIGVFAAVLLGGSLATPAGAATATPSLTCHGDPANSAGAPVLLVPGTFLNPDVNFDWNYEKAFTTAGRAWCAVTLPHHTTGDAQVAGQDVALAIRSLHARAGRRIAVVGYSQGGMLPRWALKYWPDTRAMVDDVIGIDPSNHGTLDAYPVCAAGCMPAIWQQQTGSNFLRALNTGPETFAGISYTQIYTATDEVVVPNLPPAASSALTTGDGARANVLVQSICPIHVSDHVSMGTTDPVGYALVIDALTHTGPAAAARIDPAVCLAPVMPAVSLADLPANAARAAAQAGTSLTTDPKVAAEPPLAPYAR